MPFLKGKAALRRTLGWLEKGEIMLRNDVRIVTMNFNPADATHANKHHDGLQKFIFWHLPQLQYKNPNVQLVTFKYLTPTPWLKFYMDDDSQHLVDCDSRSREEIHDHVKLVFGKTDATLKEEASQAASILENPGNFGATFPRHCICEIPGQMPCPQWKPLPFYLRGKYKVKQLQEEMTREEVDEASKEAEQKWLAQQCAGRHYKPDTPEEPTS